MRDVGTETAESRLDGFSAFGMKSDLARQREQLQRHVEFDRFGRKPLGNTRARRFLSAVGLLAQLHVRAEAPGLHHNRFSGFGIGAQDARRRLAVLARSSQLAGETAFRIVGAADEGAEAAEPQTQPAVAATGTEPRIAAV